MIRRILFLFACGVLGCVVWLRIGPVVTQRAVDRHDPSPDYDRAAFDAMRAKPDTCPVADSCVVAPTFSFTGPVPRQMRPPLTIVLPKQYGGSTGDSVAAKPDTSCALTMPRDIVAWWATVSSDVFASYRIQVSDDQGTRWSTIYADSVVAGRVDISRRFPIECSGMYTRVIFTSLTGASAAYGRVTIRASDDPLFVIAYEQSTPKGAR